MTAEFFSSKLSDYIDGELPETDRIGMEKSITESPAHSAIYENMILLLARLGNLAWMQPSAEFEFRLRRRILLEAANQRRAPQGQSGWLPTDT